MEQKQTACSSVLEYVLALENVRFIFSKGTYFTRLTETDLAQAILSKVLPLLLMELCWSHAQPGTGRPIRSAFMTRLHKVNVQWKKREVMRRMVQETPQETPQQTSAETPSLDAISATHRSGENVSPIRMDLTECLPEATKNRSLPQTEVSLRDEAEPIVCA